MISTRTHGYLDYLMGMLLIVSPLLIELPSGAATAIPVILGAGVIVYSLITDYEMGLLKIVSMPTHLTIDIIAGIFLTASPWIFGFADEIFWPFVILGVLEIGAGALTSKRTSQPTAPKT